MISPISLSRLEVEAAPAGRRRLSGALSVSLLAHVSLAALLGIVAHRISSTTVGKPDARSQPIARMAWRGFGGGGNGDNHPAPPRQLERPGHQRIPAIAAPASSTIPTAAPQPRDDVPPVVAAIASVESGLQISPGVSAAIVQPGDFLGPGSGGGPGTGKGRGNGNGDGDGLNDGSGEGTGGGPPGAGDTAPVLLRQVRPNYTSAGVMARAQGVMDVEAVVLPDGSVGDVRIVRSFEPPFGLDQEAVTCVKQWRFLPGKRQGRAVPMRVSIELSFTLR